MREYKPSMKTYGKSKHLVTDWLCGGLQIHLKRFDSFLGVQWNHTWGVLSTPCMTLKSQNNYTLFVFFKFFSFMLLFCPLPIIRFVLDFDISRDIVFMSKIPTKQIDKKADRFFTNPKNIHDFTSIYLLL